MGRQTTVTSFFGKKGGVEVEGRSRKRLRAEVPVPEKEDPAVILFWNANGLGVRLKNEEERGALKDLIRKEKPDVVCVSEVRLAACKVGDEYDGGRLGNGGDRAIWEQWLSSDVISEYESWVSLADRKYSGTCVLVKRSAVCPESVRYRLEADERHDAEGRVILMEFGTFWLLHTYAPNNGWEENQFRRRREWDEEIRSFVSRRAEDPTKGLIWIGDLNVAPEDADLSHPQWFRTKKSEKNPLPSDPGDRGQPGCTLNERERFHGILRDGNMVDGYRWKHPAEEKPDLTAPIFTWRGTPGKVRAEIGKYYGKGMRIDHTVASASLASRIEDVEILGWGFDRKGFLGSDHSPVILRLAAPAHEKDRETLEAEIKNL